MENNCGDCICKKCKHRNTDSCPFIVVGMCSECGQIYVTTRCPELTERDNHGRE